MDTAAGIASYRDLMVWKSAVELAVDCYSITERFPKSEVYGMTSQMRRAATSVAANIAEGHGRENTGSFIQFLRIAQGSLKELETLAVVSGRVNILDAHAASKIAGSVRRNRSNAQIPDQESAGKGGGAEMINPYSLFASRHSHPNRYSLFATPYSLSLGVA